jgi:polynucleotide 5'-hydroxyl-kinase GRC3/NOL9
MTEEIPPMTYGNEASRSNLDIPQAWREIDFSELRGTILVIGAPDAGKSTFINYLYSHLVDSGRLAAYLDGDPGQSLLGPPTTLTVVTPGFQDPVLLDESAALAKLARQERFQRKFVGSTSPVGHMLPTLVAGVRLVEAARQTGADPVLYDTCGLVDQSAGGLALKHAKVELLRPEMVYALQREDELEALLAPLRKSRLTRVTSLRPSPAAKRRSAGIRQNNRIASFAAHFEGAHRLTIDWTRLAVFPFPRFSLHRLAAFEDEQGFTTSLAIVVEIDRSGRQLTLLTPQPSLKGVTSLRLGSLEIDPVTFQHHIRFFDRPAGA